MSLSDFLQKHKLSEGNLVSVLTKQQILEGTILPSNDETTLVLKLKNGYNAGIKLDEVSEIHKLGEGKTVGKPPVKEIQKKTGKPTIAILHTGGTIASRVNYQTGGVVASFEAEDFAAMFPEVLEIANIESVLVSNMMSEDMVFEDYQKIAAAVENEIKKGVKGVIIGHGTDTLAFTSAILSFMLENCPIPVILVGAQRSTDRGASDGIENLVCAAEFIAKTDFAGVAICMHETTNDKTCVILPGPKTRKMHTSRRDAFKAINDKPIARVNFETREITFLKDNYQKKKGKFSVLSKMESKVAILKTHPVMVPEQFLFFKNYKGLIIEATGLGHAPTNTENNLGNYEALKTLLKNGVVIALTSQCIFGRVNPTVYTNLRRLSNIGIIYCEDMLSETAFLKLAWLLGQFPNNPEKVKKLMLENLRGEITERTEFEEEFIE